MKKPQEWLDLEKQLAMENAMLRAMIYATDRILTHKPPASMPETGQETGQGEEDKAGGRQLSQPAEEKQGEGDFEKEREKQEQIFNWCKEMAGNDPIETEKKVIAYTTFTVKKPGGKTTYVPGVGNPYDLKGARLNVTYDRVQKAYDAWKEKENTEN